MVGGLGGSGGAPGGRQGGRLGRVGPSPVDPHSPRELRGLQRRPGFVASWWGEGTGLGSVVAPVLGLGRQVQRAHHRCGVEGGGGGLSGWLLVVR